MARARVSSFMTTFGYKLQHPGSSSPSPVAQEKVQPGLTAASSASSQLLSSSPSRDAVNSSTPPATRTERSSSRPTSMIYQPPLMDTVRDTPPELLPIFTFLNSHANKLYQEGYFLKLNDLDISGHPNNDRNWTECFAQLVGTILSLWDAAALDAAGQDGEVAPTFINLADASIKMIETLPTRNEDVQPLQNVLSISTAGKNRYLLHFNSFHSLTQWTAGIRLAMFENTSLQELYTGSLIAGKGKLLNNIRVIMERSRFRNEDWARVRFGAGTPWRRCWCVIDPPNEKDFQKEQKSLKKRSAYGRPAILRGDIKFYDTKKTKKTTPIATITDAYSAYAIYPQSKPLIDQSTLVKVEGRITIHSKPESNTEGFVFVMPEVHPAVSGFEMMLRWLFPVYDTFGLYGRPTRLIADTFDSRGLMFAMPKERRYGYLDIQDVASMVCKQGSESWSDQEWRTQMKDATSKRLSSKDHRATIRQGSRKVVRTSLPAGADLQYDDGASIRSTPSRRYKDDQSQDMTIATREKTRTAPQPGSLTSATYHARSASDTLATSRKPQEHYVPSRLSIDQDTEEADGAPPPPLHGIAFRRNRPGALELPKPQASLVNDPQAPVEQKPDEVGSDLQPQPPPTPVAAPPAFLHSPGGRPPMRPNPSLEMRRANSRMSISTLSQLVDASTSGTAPNAAVAAAGAAAAWRSAEGIRSQDQASRGVNETSDRRVFPADQRLPRKGLVAAFNDSELESADPHHAQARSDSTQQLEGLNRSSVEQAIFRKPGHTNQAMASSSQSIKNNGSDDEYTSAILSNTPSSSTKDNQPVRPPQIHDPHLKNDSGTFTCINEPSVTEVSESQGPESSILKRGPGTLGTAGDPNAAESSSRTNIPNVPASSTPNHSPGIKNGTRSAGTRNASPRWDNLGTPPDSATPTEERRSSCAGGPSPHSGSNSPSQSRSPNPVDGAVAWQPGSAAVGPGRKSPGPRISPQEFVHQRVTTGRATTPVYAHRKNRSTGQLLQERPASTDWTKPREVGPRPSSGDMSTLLGQQQTYSTKLSAREQEHLARVTNSPLVNLNVRRHHSPQPSAGLVGAIEAREQEKKQARQGISSQMVQHAIAQRQLQAQHEQQYQALQQQVYHQQLQSQAQVLSPQLPVHQGQIVDGFFGLPWSGSQSTPASPGGWPVRPSSQVWPNTQTQAYWNNMPPVVQVPQKPGGQQQTREWQTRVRKPEPGQK